MNLKEKLIRLKEKVDMLDLINLAIGAKLVIKFHYSGSKGIGKGLRSAEPYVLGDLKGTDRLALRAYQLTGDSAGKVAEGWKLFLLDNISGVIMTKDMFNKRSEYNKNDRGFTTRHTVVEKVK